MEIDPQARFHLLSDGSRYAIFCPDTVVALALEEATFHALANYLQTADRTSAGPISPAPPEPLQQTLQHLVAPPALVLPHLLETDASPEEEPDAEMDSRLDRLVLHVSSDCNLRCRYCYAEGGAYGRPRGNMPREIAFTALDWMVRFYGGVRQVQFFGGEPLLNPLLMIEVCEYCKALQEAGHLSQLPQFGMVTNGVLGDDRVLKFLQRYGVSVTVSIDGPQEVHDALRGEGSFAAADRFARQCLHAPEVQVDFECTWTPVHVEMGLSVVDLIDFFHERYERHTVHIPPVSASPGSALYLDPEVKKQAYIEAARYSVQNLARGDLRANSLSWRVLEALRKREPIGPYCPAGAGTLAVGTDGGAYPCFMFAGEDDFCLFRFSPEGEVQNHRSREMSILMAACHKEAQPACCSCWAAPLCSGCLGGDFIEGGDIAQRTNCDTIRAIAEAIILEVSAKTTHCAPSGP